MHLFYNIDENGQPLNDTTISSRKAAAREIIQRENSRSMLEYIKKQYREYDESGYSSGAGVCSSLSKNLEKLFDDFENKCQEDYESDPFSHLFELQHWEKDFISIAESLPGSSSNLTVFRNVLLHRMIIKVLSAKLLLFKNVPNNYSPYQDRIEKILATGIKTENYKTLMSSIKRAVKSFAKDNANWTNVVPQKIFRIIEAGQYLILSQNGRLNDISNTHDALQFHTCFLLYKQLLQYEEKVTLSSYNGYQQAAETDKLNSRHRDLDTYILDTYDKKQVKNILRRHLKGRRGKQAVMVIRAAYAAGLTTRERIPFSTVTEEFGYIGVQSGYHHFFDDAYLSVSECQNLIDKFRLIKPIDN